MCSISAFIILLMIVLSFIVLSLIHFSPHYNTSRARQRSKSSPGPNSLLHFQARKKKTHQGLTRFLVFKLVKKRSTGPEKKTRKGLNSLSYFRAHEKEVHWTSFLIFVYERHQSHYASAFDSCCYFALVLR